MISINHNVFILKKLSGVVSIIRVSRATIKWGKPLVNKFFAGKDETLEPYDKPIVKIHIKRINEEFSCSLLLACNFRSHFKTYSSAHFFHLFYNALRIFS